LLMPISAGETRKPWEKKWRGGGERACAPTAVGMKGREVGGGSRSYVPRYEEWGGSKTRCQAKKKIWHVVASKRRNSERAARRWGLQRTKGMKSRPNTKAPAAEAVRRKALERGGRRLVGLKERRENLQFLNTFDWQHCRGYELLRTSTLHRWRTVSGWGVHSDF